MPSVVVASRQRSLQEQFKEALALEEEIIDKQRQAEVQQIVSSAREQLRPFASTVMHPTFKPGLMGFLRPSWREMQTVYVNTGGAGHIGFSLSFALIDRDGSGELSSSELQAPFPFPFTAVSQHTRNFRPPLTPILTCLSGL